MRYILVILGIFFASPLLCEESSQESIALLQDKEYLTKLYKKYIGKEINWENPTTFTEKIQWLKLYNRHPIHTICQDKYLERNYVAEKIGAEYLVPLLGVYDNADEIDFSKLPSKFVLKTNHGSGWNIICKDKTKLNQQDARDKLTRWLQQDYSVYSGEWAYKNIPRKIICEQFIGEEIGDIPDYKFYCFNGIPKLLHVNIDLFTQHKRAYYSLLWEKLPFTCAYPIENKSLSKPKNFEQMLEIATKLSKGFKFVRIDLYNIEGKIYFGEMTLYPDAGIGKFTPEIFDEQMGSLLNLHDPNCPY
jgi:hypothetical protein